ncbi:hypothetical protein GE061_019955 [Apolygus lucorum]|uniref:DDE Tnp4 domain-containing protein n=1 Tax=Apolygus lucorum TaxID=248454 RepID=A0A8S9XBV1_APOLU|nr:hypothetical protein GE061_019955 [Apolygus lucorum]
MERRRVWFSIAKLPVSTHHFYCCEDHFDLQKDTENWMWYKTVGQKLILKPNIVPHMCLGTPRKTEHDAVKRTGSQLSDSSKKRKLQFLSNFKGISEPSASGVSVQYECPQSVPRRRKQILTPRPFGDQGIIEVMPSTTVEEVQRKTPPNKNSRNLKMIPPTIVEEGSTSETSLSPMAFRLPVSPPPRVSRPQTKSHQKPNRGSSSSSVDSLATLTSAWSSDSDIRGLEWKGKGYGGRISDSMLVQKSGFLQVLPTSCDVLADRGFKQLERLFVGRGCSLIRPPSVGAGEKLPPELVKWSRRISAVRIHVERVIGRMREFSMLGPHACIDNHLIPFLDHAVTVAAAIINLQDPIL